MYTVKFYDYYSFELTNLTANFKTKEQTILYINEIYENNGFYNVEVLKNNKLIKL